MAVKFSHRNLWGQGSNLSHAETNYQAIKSTDPSKFFTLGCI